MSKKEREACVDAFAQKMKNKLEENAHKGDREGWTRDPPAALLRRLREEVRELAELISTEAMGCGPLEVEGIAREAADVANFAMMIADCCGGLVLDGDDE